MSPYREPAAPPVPDGPSFVRRLIIETWFWLPSLLVNRRWFRRVVGGAWERVFVFHDCVIPFTCWRPRMPDGHYPYWERVLEIENDSEASS